MVRKEGVVAQSGDSKKQNGNEQTGAIDAEQILDRIIEHMESDNGVAEPPVATDENELSSGDGETAAKSPVKPDFTDIEQRAARLASMLGGAGLSFNEGAKRHLALPVDEDEHGTKIARIEASIHSDDLHMDQSAMVRDGVDDLVGRGPEVSVETEQAKHVQAWEADALEDDNPEAVDVPENAEISQAEETVPVEREQHLSSVVEGPLESENVANVEQGEALAFDDRTSSEEAGEHKTIEEGEGTAVPTELTVRDKVPDFHSESETTEKNEPGDGNTEIISRDLKNIEQQIEALSMSMREPEAGGGVDPVEAVSDEMAQNTALEELHSRVSSLEIQIVQLLDRITTSEEQLGQTIGKTVREETRQSVHEAIAGSELVESVKAELKHLGEERRQQEVRISDSLDALHDALKELGERVSVVEKEKRTAAPASDRIPNAMGGIASSVLSTRIHEPEMEQSPADELDVAGDSDEGYIRTDSRDSEAVVEEELPTWLEDATSDLHGEDVSADLVQADVFASDIPLSSKESETVSREIRENGEPVEYRETAGQAIQDQLRDSLSGLSTIGNTDSLGGKTDDPEFAPDRGGEAENRDQPEDQKDNDFLSAARAAARAANARALDRQEEHAGTGNVSGDPKNSNFLEAIRKKQQEQLQSTEPTEKDLPENIHRGPVKSATSTRNSLFSDKVEGPNSLLIFTSLVLFGTSALLLYGMSKKTTGSGSVATVNAVESRTAPPRALATKRPDAVGKSRQNRGMSPNRVPGQDKRKNGQQSQLQDNSVRIASNEETGSDTGSDTLTDYDRMVRSRMSDMAPVPSSIEITGALSGGKSQDRTGSLFDEYVGFSGLASRDTKGKIKGRLNSRDPLMASARGGNALAQYEVARRFGTGEGVSKSLAISVEWYEKSAKAGYAPAIYRLATMYERGNGVAKNYKRAMRLYKEAARKGNIKAMHNLAVLYTGGNLGRTDYSKAVKWYRRAAEFGVRDSQFNLAIIYQNGLGGKADLPQAYKWYSLAAAQGDLEAKDLARDVEEQLTRQQRKRIRQELRNWKPKTPDRNANARTGTDRKKV